MRRLSSDEKSLLRSRLSSRPFPTSRDLGQIASGEQGKSYGWRRCTSLPVFRSRRRGIRAFCLPQQSSRLCAGSPPSPCLESDRVSSSSQTSQGCQRTRHDQRNGGNRLSGTELVL